MIETKEKERKRFVKKISRPFHPVYRDLRGKSEELVDNGATELLILHERPLAHS